MNMFSSHPVIMQIIPELSGGGAEQGCIDMAAEIVKAGGRAIIVSNGGNRVRELERIGAEHISLPVHSKNPIVMWKNVSALRKLIEKHEVDIVHARSRAPAWSALAACKKTRARFMTTCHAPYNMSGEAKKFYNSSMAQGERVIAISQFVAEYLHEHYQLDEQVIRLVPRGIPIERFQPAAVTPQRMVSLSEKWRVPDGANIVLLPARLTRWKGHSVLIEALAHLNRDDIFCVLTGADAKNNEYRKELEGLIEAKGLSEKVRIVEYCNDLPAAYMLATVVVCPSTDPEGFGRVPVEAQAMGRPIVASDHGGARETIIRGQTGWLVEPGNAEALAHGIEEALSLNAEQRKILASCAMNHVLDNFTKTQMAVRTLDVYRELLGEQQSSVLLGDVKVSHG